MSAKSNRKKKADGPYLNAAVLCESVVEGADKTMSVIRIIDRVTLTIPANAPPDVPSKNKAVPITLHALVNFRTGYSKGNHEISLVTHSPSGKKHIAQKQTMVFGKAPHSGANLNATLMLMIRESGLYWFDVALDGKIVTRMPLDVVVEREPAPADSPATTPKKPPARRSSRPRA